MRSLHFPSRNSQVIDIEFSDNDVESLSSGLVINKVPPIIKAGLNSHSQQSPNINTAQNLLKSAIEDVDGKPLNIILTTDDPSEIFDVPPVTRVRVAVQFFKLSGLIFIIIIIIHRAFFGVWGNLKVILLKSWE